MPTERSLTEALARAVERAMTELSVCLPGRVERYDHTQQRADVVPLLRKRYADGQIGEPQVITNVPVVFPRSGGASLTFPVRPGDGVMLHFADRSIDDWLSEGGTVTPTDSRKHDISDCIAVPGLYAFDGESPQDNNDDVLLKYADSEVRLKGDGDVEVNTEGSIVVNAAVKATVNSPEIDLGEDADLEPSVLGNKLAAWIESELKPWLDSHQHIGNLGSPTGPASGAPTGPFEPGTGAQGGDVYSEKNRNQ